MIEYTVQVYKKCTTWLLNVLYHSDGPAVDADGDKYWYLNGVKLHRTDGPAVEYASGTKCWYLNGQLHRADGPAVEYASGTNYWYLNGEHMTEAEYALAVAPKPTCAGKTVEIDGVKYVLTAV